MAERGTGETLLGVAAIGLGSLIGYAAYRNVPVFGPEGLLTGALRTGKLQPISAKTAQAQAQGSGEPWWEKLIGSGASATIPALLSKKKTTKAGTPA